jgi:LuxR family maltose regulon positive regulatory protein
MVMLLSWLDRLPDELVRSRPQLQIFQAWALALTGRQDAAESYLRGIDAESWQGEVAAVRAYVAFLRQDPHAVELSRQALELLPEQNFIVRSMMALSLGTATYWALGEPVAAGKSLTEAIRMAKASGDNNLVLSATSTLGFSQEMRGQLHHAAETYRQALQLATPPSLPGESRGGSSWRIPPFAGLAHIGLAGLLYEWNDLAEARRHAQAGIELGERSQSVDVLQGGCSYLIMAQIQQAYCEMDKAVELIRKAEQFAQSHNQAYVVALTAAVQARLWLAQGNLTAVARWARDRDLSANDDLSYARETEYISLVRLLVARGRTSDALGLLARLLAAAQAVERNGSALKILVVTALAFQAHNDEKRALSKLEQVLTLAEPEGYVRTFIDEGEPMVKLLRRALSEGIVPNYAARLLATFGQETERTTPAMESLVEPLSDRELEVLRLVAVGLSNREIAEELYLSINTVKTHTKNIYGKLNVRGRMQAVDRAEELNLL